MAILAQEQDRLADRLAEIRPHLVERQWRLLLGLRGDWPGRGEAGGQGGGGERGHGVAGCR